MYSSTDEWKNKICYMHTMKYYLGIKSNNFLMHAITWMNFENIMQTKISQM